MKYICSKCGHREEVTTHKAKCECGGLWKLDFKAPIFSLDEVDKSEWSMFRYRRFMALEDDSWKDISLGEGLTPIVRFDDNVLLKMDYFMPTLSFKDRGAAVLMAHCKSIGVDKVVQDSSGTEKKSKMKVYSMPIMFITRSSTKGLRHICMKCMSSLEDFRRI